MGDIGRTRPGFDSGEEVTKWEVPIVVFDNETGDKFKVVSVYEDEGFFCINIEIPTKD